MIYQGPESFRDFIEKSYHQISAALTRTDSPQIIVGGIGRIYNNGPRVITEGDQAGNSRIDEKFVAMQKASPSQFTAAYDELIAVCDEANIMKPSKYGEYNNSLDVVILSPDRIVKYLIASRLDSRRVWGTRNAGQITAYLVNINFPNHFAHEMVHWDFGDTQFNTDLQRKFHAVGFSFDKAIAGKFSFDTSPEDASVYRQEAQQAAGEGLNANSELSKHFAKLIELGIFELGEMAAEITAAFIAPTNGIPAAVSGPEGLVEKLVSKVRADGPAEFIKFLKSKIDDAYRLDRKIEELL